MRFPALASLALMTNSLSGGVPTSFGDREVVEGTAVEDLPDLPGLPLRPAAGAATALVLDGTELPAVLEPLLHA